MSFLIILGTLNEMGFHSNILLNVKVYMILKKNLKTNLLPVIVKQSEEVDLTKDSNGSPTKACNSRVKRNSHDAAQG